MDLKFPLSGVSALVICVDVHTPSARTALSLNSNVSAESK